MVEEAPLSGDERAELKEATASVDLADLDALDELLGAVAGGEVQVDEELIFALGAWWGAQVRAATGWRWVQLRLGRGLEAPGLVSEDRGVAVLPLQLVAAALDGDRPERLVAILRRLRQGERPHGAPGSYAIVD